MAVAPRVKPSESPAASEAGERPISAPAYIVRGRDLRIDFLRGLCVIAMIVDHVAGSSWLYVLTGGNRFYTSAAEGFVFVSGLVAGRAYTRFIARDGLSYGLGRVLGRAGQLYLLAVCLALAFAPVSEVLHLPWAVGWNLHAPVDFVVSVLTLHRTYYLVDVMLLYVLLLLTSSIALVLCTRGQAWLVLGASWLLWLMHQVVPEQVAMPWPIVGNNLFTFAAWQVLFFTGLVLGHAWETGLAPAADNRRSRWVQRLVDVVQVGAIRRRWLRITGALLAVTIAFYVVQDQVLGRVFARSADPGLAQVELLTSVFGKSDLRFGRVLAFGLVFVVFFLAATEWWPMLRRWLGWLVLPLGQNALYAYSAHVVLAASVAIAQRQLGSVEGGPARENAAFQLASVLAVWVLVRLRPPARVFAPRRLGLAVPVLLAVGALLVLPRVVPPGGDNPNPAVAAASSAEVDNSAAAQVARAYGTVIPAGAGQPRLTSSAAASPVPQPTPNPTSTVSNAAGRIQGTLLEPGFHSAALNTEERFYIYLPPGYQTQTQRYPTLYMLHGAGGRREWVDYGLVGAIDKLISSGNAPPMIIVMPQGDESYWVNHNNGPRWGDYVWQDLVGYIDATYPTQADAKHRAIGGLSMGGWGALYQAFSHPDIFGTVGAHAPSLRGDDGSMAFLPRGAQFNHYDPLQLASNAPITNLHIWVDADAQDPWVKRDQELHNRLEQRHISNAWNTYPGQHGGSYWHDHVQDYLKFYVQALNS